MASVSVRANAAALNDSQTAFAGSVAVKRGPIADLAANAGTIAYPALARAAANLLAVYGTEEQKRLYMQPIIDGRVDPPFRKFPFKSATPIGEAARKLRATLVRGTR